MTARTPLETRPTDGADLMLARTGQAASGHAGVPQTSVPDPRTDLTAGQEPSPANLESSLSRLLDELSLVQDDMLEVLAAKCERIADGDLAGITALQQREESLGQRLQACHDQRAALLAMAADEGLPGDTLGSLAKSLKPGDGGHLAGQVKEASARMRLLQHRSLANWVLTQRSMLHLSQLLEIVATGGRLQPTYGRDESSISSGALVDKDA